MEESSHAARIEAVKRHFADHRSDCEVLHGSGNDIVIELKPGTGFIDPTDMDRIKELGYELKSVYTGYDAVPDTAVVLRTVGYDD